MTPFFIFTTPRCRGDLLVRILAATPGVACAGEANDFLRRLRRLHGYHHAIRRDQPPPADPTAWHPFSTPAGEESWDAALRPVLSAVCSPPPGAAAFGMRDTWNLTGDWAADSAFLTWLHRLEPAARFIFLRRDQAAVEISVERRHAALRGYGKCPGSILRRIRSVWATMEKYHALNPETTLLLDSERLLDYPALRDDLAAHGIPVCRKAWETHTALVPDGSAAGDDSARGGVMPFRNRLGNHIYYLGRAMARKADAIFLEKGEWLLGKMDHGFPMLTKQQAAGRRLITKRCDAAELVASRARLSPMLLPDHPATGRIAAHVRLGDKEMHPDFGYAVPAPDYYARALALARHRTGAAPVTLFSDDPARAREILGDLAADWTVDDSPDAMTAFRRMASCQAVVCADSTLSAAAAILSPHCRFSSVPAGVRYPFHFPEEWPRIPSSAPETYIPIPAEFPRAIVYPWTAARAAWDELRQSLRTVHRHFADQECPILILGDAPPAWLREDAPRVRFIRIPDYAAALACGLQIAEKVLWMNDDIYFRRPSGWDDFRPGLRTGVDLVAGVEAMTNDSNSYRRGRSRVVLDLLRMGVKRVENFSTHTPYLFERARAVRTLDAFGCFRKIPFETAYWGHHTDLPTRILTDEKSTLVLNHSDRTLTDALKAEIQALAPGKAPWEG